VGRHVTAATAAGIVSAKAPAQTMFMTILTSLEAHCCIIEVSHLADQKNLGHATPNRSGPRSPSYEHRSPARSDANGFGEYPICVFIRRTTKSLRLRETEWLTFYRTTKEPQRPRRGRTELRPNQRVRLGRVSASRQSHHPTTRRAVPRRGHGHGVDGAATLITWCDCDRR
jgi:hypothetical protein